jgi:hypothetical protein
LVHDFPPGANNSGFPIAGKPATSRGRLSHHNLTEALQLSDRILVITYRPGKTKWIVDIKLPRARTSEIVGSDAFSHYIAQIWNDLREEARRVYRMTKRAAREPDADGVGMPEPTAPTDND